jgi:hypothetical protein
MSEPQAGRCAQGSFANTGPGERLRAASHNPSQVAAVSYETCPGGRKPASRDRVFLDST